jgi:hypothetical protein
MPDDTEKPTTKKPYRKPTLTTYGDVRVLTQTSTASGQTNDMTTGMFKSR